MKKIDLRFETLTYKGYKIAAQFFFWGGANFPLIAGFFWYRCYYPHQSRDALSPVYRIFEPKLDGSSYTKTLQ